MNNHRDHYKTAAILLKVLFSLEIVLFLLFWVYPHIQPPSLSDKAQTGSPYFFREKKAWFSELADYSRDEDHVYVLYDNGVVECYDFNGRYQYSVLFPRGANGKPHLHESTEGFVYEHASDHDYYIVAGENDFRFIGLHDDEYRQVEETLASDVKFSQYRGTDFYISGSNLFWETMSGTRTQITRRPGWFSILQDNRAVILTAVIFIAILILFGIVSDDRNPHGAKAQRHL